MTTATKKTPKAKAAKIKAAVARGAKVNKEHELDSLKQVQEALSGCSLTFHWWGILKVVDREDNETAAKALNAESNAIRTQRRLIDTGLDEWKALQQIRSATKQWYDWRTFPYVVTGQRLFRKEMRDTIWSQVAQFAEELNTAANALNNRRADVIEWAKAHLGDAFDERLYPEDWRKSFALTIREHSIEPPSYLRHTNAEEYQQTLRRSLQDIGASMQRFESQCMAQVGSSVGRLASALTNGGGIREATVANMQDTFKRIMEMRFEGTAVFKSAMREAEDIVNGVSMFELRNSHGTREETRKKLEQLMARHKELAEAAVKKAAVEVTQ